MYFLQKNQKKNYSLPYDAKTNVQVIVRRLAEVSCLKIQFCEKYFLYECNSDKSPSFFFIKIRFSCNQNNGDTFTQ